MYPDINSILDQAVYEHEHELNTRLANIKNDIELIQSLNWPTMTLFLTDKCVKMSKTQTTTGVYAIYHCDPDPVMFYIGQGLVAKRRSRHKSVFNNKGVAKQAKDGEETTSYTDSVIGRKMYQKDPNPYHWFWTHVECEIHWAVTLERLLIELHMPEGNIRKENHV